MSSPEESQITMPDEFGIGRLFRLIQDGVVVANARTERIIRWNDAAERLFGYTEEEALELPLHALVPARLRDLHRTGLRRFQETGTGLLISGGRAVELPALRKDGTELPIELSLTAIPVDDEHGDRFALAIVRDVSDRKEAERARIANLDREQKQIHALELNDTIVQGLATVKMALDIGKTDVAQKAADNTLKRAKQLVSSLLEGEGGFATGGLRRDFPAEVHVDDAGS